jgi:hypothetical protein
MLAISSRSSVLEVGKRSIFQYGTAGLSCTGLVAPTRWEYSFGRSTVVSGFETPSTTLTRQDCVVMISTTAWDFSFSK